MADQESIHVHLWKKTHVDTGDGESGPRIEEEVELVADADAACTDHQPDLGGDDGYFQFGSEMPDGNWLEMRVSDKLVRELFSENMTQLLHDRIYDVLLDVREGNCDVKWGTEKILELLREGK